MACGKIPGKMHTVFPFGTLGNEEETALDFERVILWSLEVKPMIQKGKAER